MNFFRSPFGNHNAWHCSKKWADQHGIKDQGVEVHRNEYYTEYCIRYVVKHSPDERTKLPPEVITEAERAIEAREEKLCEIVKKEAK